MTMTQMSIVYIHLEDDLIIHDPQFFKNFMVPENDGFPRASPPQRVEFSSRPHLVDKLYIDGPYCFDLSNLPLKSTGPVYMQLPGGDVLLKLLVIHMLDVFS